MSEWRYILPTNSETSIQEFRSPPNTSSHNKYRLVHDCRWWNVSFNLLGSSNNVCLYFKNNIFSQKNYIFNLIVPYHNYEYVI
jgi:hypothetical protein